MEGTVRVATVLVCMMLGALAVATPCWVYVRHHIFKWMALWLLLCGTVLMTVSRWTSVEVEAFGGMKLRMEQLQAALQAAQDQQIKLAKELDSARVQWSTSMASLADAQKTFDESTTSATVTKAVQKVFDEKLKSGGTIKWYYGSWPSDSSKLPPLVITPDKKDKPTSGIEP